MQTTTISERQTSMVNLRVRRGSFQYQHLMNFQRRQLNNRTVRIDDLEDLVAWLDKSLLKRSLSQVHFDPVNRHGLLTQRHIHGRKTVIGRRVQSVEEVNHCT